MTAYDFYVKVCGLKNQELVQKLVDITERRY